MVDFMLVLKVAVAIPVTLVLVFMLFKVIFSAWFSAKTEHLSKFANFMKGVKQNEKS